MLDTELQLQNITSEWLSICHWATLPIGQSVQCTKRRKRCTLEEGQLCVSEAVAVRATCCKVGEGGGYIVVLWGGGDLTGG